jgi:AcrR family transcriptional regulator
MTVARKKAALKKPAGAPAPKWRRRAHARPDELLDAALDEFIAKGFDAARIEDIARRAGLSKGAVYLYFTGKEDLLRALIEREVAPVLGRVKTIAKAAGDPRATLTLIARAIGTALSSPRLVAIPQLVISIANRFPELRDYYRKQVVGQAKGAIETLYKRGIELGQFRDIPAHAAARTLIGPIFMEAIWTHMLRGKTGMTDSKWIERHFEIVLAGLEKR